jgi:hypothetical protein
MLAEADLIEYLFRRKLVDAASVVAGDLAIVDASRRNRNYAILRRCGPAYLLKQASDPERNASIANEARVYKLLHAGDTSYAFARYLPRYFGYDPDEHVVVIEFLTDAQDLQKHHARTGRFSTKLAAMLGHALSLLHGVNFAKTKGDANDLICPPPWIFSLHRPDALALATLSEAHIEVVKIVQCYPEFGARLDEMLADWQAESFIHADLRWDNCLMWRSAGHPDLKIVDWELAGIGDALWDVGSVLGNYLGLWLRSLPITAETDLSHSLQLARYPLERMQPALRAFWRAYVRGSALPAPAAEPQLVRATRYAAARLAQTACEQMQASPQLTGNAVTSLQLSLNILRRPKEAASALLGIAFPADGATASNVSA